MATFYRGEKVELELDSPASRFFRENGDNAVREKKNKKEKRKSLS